MTLRIRELSVSYCVRTISDDGITGRKLNTPSAAALVLAAWPVAGSTLAESPVERFGVLVLDAKHHVRSVATVGVGIVNSCLVHPREVFGPAILGSAAAIIVWHNHPSGDPTPSIDDVSITQRLMAAGELLGISVLDHVIIGHDGRYYSFKEHGRMMPAPLADDLASRL